MKSVRMLMMGKAAEVEVFVLSVTVGALDSISIPMLAGFTYDYTIDWGDGSPLGTVTAYDDLDAIHEYADADTYNVIINGTCETFFVNNDATSDSITTKLISITSWASAGLKNVNFYGCFNLTSVPDTLTTLTATSLQNCFHLCSSFNSSIDNWDISGVEVFHAFLRGCTIYNQSMNNWDISGAISLNTMFYQCTAFNSNITSWDVSNVVSFNNVFGYCTNFNQPIDSWSPSVSLTDMNQAFQRCTNFNQSLNSWNVSGVTSFYQAFYYCTNFNGNITSWDVSGALIFERMFQSASVFNQDIGSWITTSATNMKVMFYQATAFNKSLNSWNVSGVTLMDNMFSFCTNYNQSMNSWNVGSVTNMLSMFQNCTNLDQSFATWNIASVSNMTGMFVGVTLSTVNYSDTLIAWALLTVQSTVTFSGGNSTYNASGLVARDILTDAPNLWNITDGGLE